ncbi:MAG: nucleotidyltransferase family protein [Spirochaetales bacterium]|nr:nucleotidyltransferase family protein [Spirochaetales bacterium]
MTDLVNIKKILHQKKPLFKKYGITEIGIFGSYIRGQETQQSDIDILIDISRPSTLGLIELIDIENKLTEELDTKVDLILKCSLKPLIGKNILQEVQYL